MNTFRYDSTSIEYFDSQDLGSIGDAPTSTVDRGTNFLISLLKTAQQVS